MTRLERDGVRLAYEEAGAGDPALVFVHPWSGNRSFFAPQAEYFGPSHRCISVDLRGHGESDSPQEGYAMADLADDVAWLCGEIGVSRAVVVGHSMGGIVAAHLAARHPELARGVVLLDSPLLPPSGFMDLVPPLIEGMRSPAFVEVTRQFQGQFIGFGEDPGRREQLLDLLAGGEQHVKVATLEHVFGDDSEAAVAKVGCPVLYVGSGLGFADLDRLASVCRDLETDTVTGAAHFIQLEVPDQVNAGIDRFLKRVG